MYKTTDSITSRSTIMSKSRQPTVGTNILRGGKRTYQCKTLMGNFVEESYRPDVSLAGFSGGEMYFSTTKSQMVNGVAHEVKEFGEALASRSDQYFDYTKLIGANKQERTSTWQSVTQSAHGQDPQQLEFIEKQKFKDVKVMTPTELDQYRHRWTKETDAMKKQRYVTENNTMHSKYVAPAFQQQLY